MDLSFNQRPKHLHHYFSDIIKVIGYFQLTPIHLQYLTLQVKLKKLYFSTKCLSTFKKITRVSSKRRKNESFLRAKKKRRKKKLKTPISLWDSRSDSHCKMQPYCQYLYKNPLSTTIKKNHANTNLTC